MKENAVKTQSNHVAAKTPLSRQVQRVSVLLVLCLGVLLVAVFYFSFRALVYRQYQVSLTEVITYVENHADADDMRRCLETGETSETYAAYQEFLNGMVDDLGLAYLYIVIPGEPGEGLMYNLISATSREEFAAGDGNMLFLETTDAYSEAELERYRSFWNNEEVGFFEESSDWGAFYTAVKPMRTGDGETIALICADEAIDEVHGTLTRMLIYSVCIVAVITALFTITMIVWLHRNVTEPLATLVRSAESFAAQSRETQDALTLRYVSPDIHCNNEIQTLAEAIEQMASDIRAGGEKTLEAQKRAEEAEVEARRIALEEARSSSVTYSRIAQALATDYNYLYYVDLETDDFIEYSCDSDNNTLAVVRRDVDFFNISRKMAKQLIYSDDQTMFLESFKREIILRALDEHGAYTITYRQLYDGEPKYTNMKITRMEDDDRHIIIGISDVDAQMRYQDAMERAQEELITYTRISALSGDFLSVYTVNPVTDRYMQYGASGNNQTFGTETVGEDFFARARKEAMQIIHPDDILRFETIFTKQNILKEVEENGIFVLGYRMMVNGMPTYVTTKAAMVQEKDGPQLIIGIINVDAQMRRDQEYERMLTAARAKANVDALTGVRNKHAYVDMEAELDRKIHEEPGTVQFAVVALDVNNLKEVNDTKGHTAGDMYLKQACGIICRIFAHSPVFRVGGDEFNVIAQGEDYAHMDELLAELRRTNEENAGTDLPIVAAGVACFEEGDSNVQTVYERADSVMYKEKQRLKDQK